MISSKFAAFLQNTFSEERLWRTASGHLHYNKKYSFLSLSTIIIHQFHSSKKILTLIPHIPTLIPCIPTLIPCISTLIPRIPNIPFSDSPFRLLHIAMFFSTC